MFAVTLGTVLLSSLGTTRGAEDEARAEAGSGGFLFRKAGTDSRADAGLACALLASPKCM